MTTMNLERFEYLADAYGADLRRWPASERAFAETLIAADPSLKAVLDGGIAGRITSSRMSPTLGRSICLGRLEPSLATPGTRVTVRLVDGRDIEALVIEGLAHVVALLRTGDVLRLGDLVGRPAAAAAPARPRVRNTIRISAPVPPKPPASSVISAAPSAIFLLMIDDASSGMDSTVPVTSRRA